VIRYFAPTSLSAWRLCIPNSFHAVQLPKKQFEIEGSNLRSFWREELEFLSHMNYEAPDVPYGAASLSVQPLE